MRSPEISHCASLGPHTGGELACGLRLPPCNHNPPRSSRNVRDRFSGFVFNFLIDPDPSAYKQRPAETTEGVRQWVQNSLRSAHVAEKLWDLSGTSFGLRSFNKYCRTYSNNEPTEAIPHVSQAPLGVVIVYVVGDFMAPHWVAERFPVRGCGRIAGYTPLRTS